MKLLLTVAEAADSVGVSEWTVRCWINAGDLPTIKLPSPRHPGQASRVIRIAPDDLVAFVTKLKAGQ